MDLVSLFPPSPASSTPAAPEVSVAAEAVPGSALAKAAAAELSPRL